MYQVPIVDNNELYEKFKNKNISIIYGEYIAPQKPRLFSKKQTWHTCELKNDDKVVLSLHISYSKTTTEYKLFINGKKQEKLTPEIAKRIELELYDIDRRLKNKKALENRLSTNEAIHSIYDKLK